jgi:hypothetical protein
MSEKKKSLIAKIKKNSTIKEADILTESEVFNKRDLVDTGVPAINLALSGRLHGGLPPGHTMIAGPSKHFKSMFGLLMAGAYMRAFPDEAAMIFYDQEFGTNDSYFENFAISGMDVLHSPLTDIEQLMHDMSVQLRDINRGERVFFFIDSIGNLATRKEAEDALKGEVKVEMQRAKVLKGFYRIVSSPLNIKGLPMVTINHSYKTLEMFSKDVVSGGSGPYYNAANIWIVGRRQVKKNKTDKEISGWDFVINVDKSRFVREKTSIPIRVEYDGGLSKYTGLFDIALQLGWIVVADKTINRKTGYEFMDKATGEMISEPMIENDARVYADAWEKLLKNDLFVEEVEGCYALGGKGKALFADEDIVLIDDNEKVEDD